MSDISYIFRVYYLNSTNYQDYINSEIGINPTISKSMCLGGFSVGNTATASHIYNGAALSMSLQLIKLESYSFHQYGLIQIALLLLLLMLSLFLSGILSELNRLLRNGRKLRYLSPNL